MLIQETLHFFIRSNFLILQVMAGQPVTISVHHLLYIDPTVKPEDIVYHITQPLPANGGQLLLMDQPGLEVFNCDVKSSKDQHGSIPL